jgi:hypothetical protein
MITNIYQDTPSEADHTDTGAWAVIFALAFIAVVLFYWTSIASSSGAAAFTVAGLGLASVVCAAISAMFALKLSKKT